MIITSFVLLLLLSCFSRVRLCVTPQTAAHQAPLSWDSPGKNSGVGCHFLLHQFCDFGQLFNFSKFHCVKYKANVNSTEHNVVRILNEIMYATRLLQWLTHTMFTKILLVVFYNHCHYLDSIRKNRIWSLFLESFESYLGRKHV